MRFAINDIVTSGPGYRPAVFLITAVDPSRPKNTYTGLNLVNRKSYRLSDLMLVKVGVGVEGAATSDIGIAAAVTDQRFLAGRRHAQRMMMHAASGPERLLWETLSKLEPNESITIRHNGRLIQSRLSHVLEKGQTYAFVATNDNGTSYKYRLTDLYTNLPMGRAKRSEAEIIEDLKAVHCALSPDNLACDGELSRFAVKQRQSVLNRQLDALERELGRPATNMELYGRNF